MKFYIAGIKIQDENLSFADSCDLLIQSIPTIIREYKKCDEDSILIIVLHEFALTNTAISKQEKEIYLKKLQAAIEGHRNVIFIPGSFALCKSIEPNEERAKKSKKIQDRYSFLNSLEVYKKEISYKRINSNDFNKIFDHELKNFNEKNENISANKEIVFYENSAYILTNSVCQKHKKSFPSDEETHLSEEQKSNYIFNIGTTILPKTIVLANGQTIDLRLLICREHENAKEANDEIERPLVEVIISSTIFTDLEQLFGALCIHMDSKHFLSVKINQLHPKAALIESVEAKLFTISKNSPKVDIKSITHTNFESSNAIKNYPLDKTSLLSLEILNNPCDYSIIAKMETSGDLTTPDRTGFHPIHYAVFKNRREILLHLLSKEIDIDERINNHENSLHCTDLGQYLFLAQATSLHLAVSLNNFSMVKLLVEEDADIDAKTQIGLTPLAIAALKGHEKIYNYLIDQEASTNLNIQIPQEIRKKTTISYSSFFTERGTFGIWKLNDGDDLNVLATMGKKDSNHYPRY